MSNISVKLFLIWTSGLGGYVLLKTSCILSSGDPYVRRSRTICAILIFEGIMRNNYVKFGPVFKEMLFKDFLI